MLPERHGERLAASLALVVARARELQHIHRPEHCSLECANRVVLIPHRRGRTGQVIDLVDLGEVRLHHIMPHEIDLSPVLALHQTRYVLYAARLEVIQTDHMMSVLDESSTEVRAEESGAAGDKRSWHAPLRCNA